MHEELIKRLREGAISADSGNEISESLYSDIMQAADAIEELSKQILEMGHVGKFLLKALLELLYLPRWIPVTDRLPPAEKEVYVTDGEYIARANLLDEVFPGDKPCWSYSGLGEITHWCERIQLPQPPKEE